MNNNQSQTSEDKLTFGKKVKYSFYSAMIFFFVSSPALYQFLQNLYGTYMSMSDDNGCPTNKGLLLHTTLFFVIILIMMSLT